MKKYLLAAAAAAQRHRRCRGQGPVPVTSTPVLPDGWTLVALQSVGSTNDEAARLAEAGAAEGTVVWAREQTGGRGRRGRIWASPVGNLYTSTIVRPQCPAARAAELGFVSALAVADIVPAGRDVRVKWPNDVLVDGGKIAGILPESSIGADGCVEHGCARPQRGERVRVAGVPRVVEVPADGHAQLGSACDEGADGARRGDVSPRRDQLTSPLQPPPEPPPEPQPEQPQEQPVPWGSSRTRTRPPA